MAITRVSDVIVPELYDMYDRLATKEKATVFTSGLVVDVADISSKLAGGGEMWNTPMWNDLADTNGSSIASDNPAEELDTDKIDAIKQITRRQYRTKGWATADLTAHLAGDDPMQAIVARTAPWWAREMNRLTVATLNGVINSNIANNAGDMVFNVGVGVGTSAPTAALSNTSTGGAYAVLEA